MIEKCESCGHEYPDPAPRRELVLLYEHDRPDVIRSAKEKTVSRQWKDNPGQFVDGTVCPACDFETKNFKGGSDGENEDAVPDAGL